MNKLCNLFLGSTLTAVLATTAFAADPAKDAKPVQVAVAPAPASQSTPSAPVPPAAAPATPAAAAPAPAPAKQAAAKIGYINMSKIGAESSAGKAAAASLKVKSGKLRARIEAKQKDLEKQKAAIEAKIEGMTAKERAAKAKEFEKKVTDYQKLVRSSEQEMQQIEEKVTSELFKNIKEAATVYAKSHGYAAIVEEKGLLYVGDALDASDLTDEIAKSFEEKKTK